MSEVAPDPDLWRARIEAALAELDALSATAKDSRGVVTLDQQSVGRLSRMDALERQAMAAATERRRRAEAQKLRAALTRIDEDEFGWCAECGGRIPDARLDIDPGATRCAECA
jgi:DnaK suppressor protein